jgi:hypothetical protein
MTLEKLDDTRVQWIRCDNEWRYMSLGRTALEILIRNLAVLDTIDLCDASRVALREFMNEGAKLL